MSLRNAVLTLDGHMNEPADLEAEISALRRRVNDLENRSADGTLSGTLRAIVEGTATISGEAFFEAMVRYLAKSLDAKYAFVGTVTPERQIRTVSVWAGDRLGENFEYDLAGTPCEAVLDGEVRHFADHVQKAFPENQLLKALGVRSYLAVPLTAANGIVLGHIAMMDVKPREKSENDLNIFQIFAARATAELQRRNIESKLDESESQKLQFEAEVGALREELHEVTASRYEFIGESVAHKAIVEKANLVASTESTVLILGESGTGKELLARHIHRRSHRRKLPLVIVNCATLPASLAESELFGHEEGAFTGASKRRVGKFELANGGTILLDEVGELPSESQSQLLRVLQDGEFDRVGGNETQKVDVRVIAATNRDLGAMVSERTFREDLFYRLNVIPLHMPPLRERRDDIPLLAKHFVHLISNSVGRPTKILTQELIDELLRYDWPGNIRELRNVMERAIILSTGGAIKLPDDAVRNSKQRSAPTKFLTLSENERQHIADAIRRCNGTIGGPNGAANLLDINVNTLRSKMEKLGMRSREANGKG